MKKTSLLLAVALAMFTLNTWAALCPKCSKLSFISSIGKCSKCENHTSSGAFKLCKQCSAKTGQCEFCQKPVAGKPFAKPAGRKAFPKHWGEPPRLQTRDLRPLPGGYGRGSSTLAGWIKKNLDLDAKNPNRGKLKLIPSPGPAPKPDPVAPPLNAPNAPKVNPAHIAKVKTALAAWAKAKAKCKGNYQYTVSFSSAFGFGHTTTIIVKNNKVVGRVYQEFNRRAGPPAPGAPPNGYSENEKTIGKNKKGAPAKTLDEIYKSAAAIAAKVLPPHEARYVRTDKNGLLTSCFIRDRRIADDAPRKGIAIGKITLGKSKANPETGKVRPPPRYVGRPAPTPNREKPAAANNAARIAALEKEIAKMKDFARRARFSREGFIKFQAKLAKLEKELADLKAGGAKPNAAGALPAKVTLKDAQGGFVGFTGWITTVNVDGSWTRSQFINKKVRPASQRGQLTAAQIKTLAETLKTANVQKLPARMGKFHGANPHVITLTCGDHQSVFTLPTGSKLPKGNPNANPQEAANRFILVANQLTELKAGAPKPPQKIYRASNGKAFPAHWGAPPRIQTRDLRPFPGGYGRGSGTLAKWIQKNMDADKAKKGGKPTFEQWVKGGMKIPAGRVFLGGTPWFDERKGERRTPREVYGMLFGKPKAQR
jgi:hypothetical protein